jgi:hypothetical protein
LASSFTDGFGGSSLTDGLGEPALDGAGAGIGPGFCTDPGIGAEVTLQGAFVGGTGSVFTEPTAGLFAAVINFSPTVVCSALEGGTCKVKAALFVAAAFGGGAEGSGNSWGGVASEGGTCAVNAE